MKTIYILLDQQYSESLPYELVKNELKEKDSDSSIYTYCLDFFNFDYLEDVKEVIIVKYYNENEKLFDIPNIIVLSELLDPIKSKVYTEKEIRKEHNVLKMFKAGSFKFKNGYYKSLNNYKNKIKEC